MDEKRKSLVSKFSKLTQEARKEGVKLETLREVFLDTGKENNNAGKKNVESKKKVNTRKKGWRSTVSQWSKQVCTTVNILTAFFLVGVLSSAFVYFYPGYVFDSFDTLFGVRTSRCAIDNNGFITEIARPLVQCGMCKSLTEVPIEHNISAENFRQKYAYSAIPVLIKNATLNWSAMDTFSYSYFKRLYLGTDGALEAVDDDCQFFPYKTEFDSLEDAFNISDDRAEFKEGEKPWYIGW